MPPVKTERTLAALCPEVSATWHPIKNVGWIPQSISVASDIEVWWVCPNGHEWSESVRDRVALRKWKRGHVAACGVCLGYHVLQVCACGNQMLTRVAAASSAYTCMACQSAGIRARWRRERLRELARTDYVADFAHSQSLLDAIVPRQLPPALAAEWRRTVRPRLRHAMQDEFGYGDHGVIGAIHNALQQIQAAGDLLPTIEELRSAQEAGEPIRFMDRTFWTHGVLHVLSHDIAQRSPDRASVASLASWVRAGFSRATHRASTYSTAAITRLITDLVEQWGHRDETDCWRSFSELVPPYIPPSGSLCGQIDVVLTRPGSPDLVVEIDSAHKPRSMEKLRFAHAAKATAVWIRWNRGAARRIPGVHIVDLFGLGKGATRR